MKKEPAPSLITPNFESLLEHQIFFGVNKHFVRKTHRKVIAPKALCWMYSEVVFIVREEKLFTGICRCVWSLLWLRENFHKIVYVVGKVLRSFTGRWFFRFYCLRDSFLFSPKFTSIVKRACTFYMMKGKTTLQCKATWQKSPGPLSK